MVIILLIMFTELIATIIGTVMLIQMGGWFAIFIAVILLLSALLNTSMILVSGCLDTMNKRKAK